MHVLLIKMSSLGDVVHALPAISDAAAHGVTFDWVVEEAFAAIPARHPSVQRVLPIAWRRWRKTPVAERGALRAFLGTLRAERYDMILDAQGLIKSAAVTALARGRLKAGFSFTSARESAAALFYNQRATVPVGGHAVDRLRQLFAASLGYPLPDGPAEFGLRASPRAAGDDRCILLHGTTWASKHWPVTMWRVLAAELAEIGWTVELPWGSNGERIRAAEISRDIAGVRVLDSMPLAAACERIASAGLVIGVDSGLTHFAAAAGVPTVVVYGATSALRTGARGRRVLNLQSDLYCAPCLKRDCRYRGEPISWRGETISPACYARLTPEIVRENAMSLLERRV